MNNLDISLLSVMLFILTLLGVSIAKVIVLRKYTKLVVVGPLLFLFIPFIFGSGLELYDQYISPIMAGLVFSIFIERWIEWFLFKIKGVNASYNIKDEEQNENISILQSIINKKSIKKQKENKETNKEKQKQDSLLKEQQERERKRIERRNRRENNK